MSVVSTSSLFMALDEQCQARGTCTGWSPPLRQLNYKVAANVQLTPQILVLGLHAISLGGFPQCLRMSKDHGRRDSIRGVGSNHLSESSHPELIEGKREVMLKRSVQNHLSYSDYYLIQALASRKGMLGNSRYFAKKELVWRIPIFGWSFWVGVSRRRE